MQKLLFKMMLLLMACPMNNWIAHSQHSQPTNSDSVVISRVAQRKCVKCLQNAPIKDSIIVEQSRRIEIKDSIISRQSIMIEKADSTVHDLDDNLSECKVENVDLQRKKKNGWKIGIPIGGAAGGILGWLLGRNIK